MALSKKPIKSKSEVNEDIVSALINKGGSVPNAVERTTSEKAQKKVLKGGQVPVQLRLSPQILDVIDDLIASKMIPIARHAWFMNAIEEQIKREQQEG